MARLNVYVPDEQAKAVRAAGLNVSALTQAAIERELPGRATSDWLASLPREPTGVTHEQAMAALEEGRRDREGRGRIAMPMDRRPLPDLLAGAWSRRANVSLRDALYVELAEATGCRLVTSDAKLGRRYPAAEVVSS